MPNEFEQVAHSATLAINERLASRRARGESVLHLGFGEAGLPVLPSVVDTLRDVAGANAYGPVTGSSRLREAAAGYFSRRGLPTAGDQVIAAPGSKALLYALIAALPGDIVLPRPSWVTYAAQAALRGKRVLWVDVPPSAGGVPEPRLLAEGLARFRRQGGRPGVLVLTLPDNPTGTAAPAGVVDQVCAVARDNDLAVVSDEIYRDLAYDPRSVVSPADYAPERCVVTSGLSKSMALGGWRIGFARFPANEFGSRMLGAVTGLASEVWSSLATPMQAVAAEVLDEPVAVTDHVTASRHLHRKVATAVYTEFVRAGAVCREPSAAFYVYPDLTAWAGALERRGVVGASAVADHLLDVHGVGVLAGSAFGDEPAAPRFRVATSLLYGETDEQRWTALNSSAPTELPWISDALSRIREVLALLTRG